jgi:lysophospholipase L1-like esterase
LANLIGGDVAVLNAGISGNRLLRQGDSFFGDSALARFDADVLGQRGVGMLVFQEGINDLQAPALAPAFGDDPPSPPVDSADLIAGTRQIIARARTASLQVVGGTLLPYEQLESLVEGAENERAEFNRWIRESGEFDAVIDFDAIMRDADHPRRLDPRYDSGDGLHPNDAGYQAMAAAAFAVLEDLR